jgi:hypothetical protein
MGSSFFNAFLPWSDLSKLFPRCFKAVVPPLTGLIFIDLPAVSNSSFSAEGILFIYGKLAISLKIKVR